MKRGAVLVGWLLALWLALPLEAWAQGLDEARWARVLERYTRRVDDRAGTRVDYRGLRGSADWRALIASLARSKPEALDEPSVRMAFWLNAYNILAIDLLVQNGPVESIRDIGSLLWPVWRREAGKLGGRAFSLGEIEHEILRPLGEARIHAAIVCASTSCPSLRREPYTALRLDEQLDDSMRVFLADPGKGLRLDANANRVRLSRVFEWFEEDFEPAGGVLEFVRPFVSDEVRAALARGPAIDYLDYDWLVNALPDSR